jgi:hypothetical protein
VGPVAAGWWLFTVAVALVLVTFVHFLGGEEREAPVRDIYAVYGNPVWGVLALVVLYGLLLSLATLLVAALRAVSSRRARLGGKDNDQGCLLRRPGVGGLACRERVRDQGGDPPFVGMVSKVTTLAASSASSAGTAGRRVMMSGASLSTSSSRISGSKGI